MSQNIKRSICFTPDMLEELQKFASVKKITVSEAVRSLLERGLSLTLFSEEQNVIRGYIREEIETVIPNIIKPYMERLIKMQANATRSSAAALMSTVAVLSENYIDDAAPEEILANALKLSTRITKSKIKPDAEYLKEAHEWLNADLKKSNDL